MHTTIQISGNVKKQLIRQKLHQRESYNEVIARMIEDTNELSEKTRKNIKLALAQAKAGKTTSHEAVGKELGF